MRLTSALLCAMALLVPACGKSNQGQAKNATMPYGSNVPAGTELNARLETPVGSFSTAGQPFTARVTSALRTTDGDVLVPEGARIGGRVVAVDNGPAPSIRLEFDSVQITGGALPLAATLRREAQNPRFRTDEIYSNDLGYEAVLYPPGNAMEGASAVGGGPTQTEQSDQTQRKIELPSGTPLKMVLTKPLFAPSGKEH